MSAEPMNGVPAVGRHPALWSVVLPALTFLIAISTIDHDPDLPFLTGNHSPYGYTVSLVLFLVPSALMCIWFRRQRAAIPDQWRAFWATTAIVSSIWILVDLLLGNAFFRFPNPGATLGILAPGYEFGVGWRPSIPVEEFAFYILGCFTILLGYIWGAESWLSAYTLPAAEYDRRVSQVDRLINVRATPIAVAVVIFLVVLVWKKFGWHDDTEGFPAYFLLELILVVAPAAMLNRAVAPVVNAPAFIFKTLTLVLTSLLWEATLALPYGWWGYRHENMMGILVRPWFNLPIEAVLLWPSAAWMQINLYEAIRIYLRSGRPLMNLLFHRRPPTVAAR